MGINLRKPSNPGIDLGKRPQDRSQESPDWNLSDLSDLLEGPLQIDELESIDESRYEPIGDDGWAMVHPEFEQFDDPAAFFWDILWGGLWALEFEIHIAWNDCEVFVSIEGRVSIYQISDEDNSGWGISYRKQTPECQPEEPPPPPPPPPIPPRPKLPRPRTICCESRKSVSVNVWSAFSGAGCDGGNSQETFSNSPARYAGDGCFYLLESGAAFAWSTGRYSWRKALSWIKLPLDKSRWAASISSWESGRIPNYGIFGIYTASGSGAPRSCYKNGFFVGKVITSNTYSTQNAFEFADGKSSCLNGDRSPPPPPRTLPPPPPNKEDKMKCCKNARDSEELLKRLYKKLEKMCKAIGVDDLPLNTPKSFIRGNDNYINLSSLAQIQNHILEQIDAVTGEFPIKIKIKDADPLTKGNQEHTVELPNIAEALAEIYGLVFETDTYVGVGNDYLGRLASEILATRSGVTKNLAYNKAIASFLGFKQDMRYQSFRSAFDRGQERDADQGTKNSNVVVEYVVNQDSETIKDYLARLMFAASIIKLAYMKDEKDLEKWQAEAQKAEVKKEEKGDDPEKVWNDFIDYLNKDGFINRGPGSIEPKAREIPKNNPLRPGDD